MLWGINLDDATIIRRVRLNYTFVFPIARYCTESEQLQFMVCLKQPSPLPEISGLRWGDYVGSPDCPNPTIVSCEEWKVDVTSLVVLVTGQFFGLQPNSCLLVKQKGLFMPNVFLFIAEALLFISLFLPILLISFGT